MTNEKHGADLIIRTKLFRPRLAAELVDRRRLLDLMDQAGDKPITLVSAPAGYGKSVLVSQWVDQFHGAAAWLSLDEDDSDLGTFLAYVLASLENVVPHIGRTTAGLLETRALPSVPEVCAHLVRDLEALDEPCALVLDDYHRIDSVSSVHALMNHLVKNPPPQLRVVLITRRDPPLSLTRLRAGRHVTEVRLRDLQFTREETAEFLAGTSQVSIGDQALENLQNEVEGWAVGLRLVTLALRHAEDPGAFLRQMHGGLALTQEYLMQEVLGSMPVAARGYLLTSSILDRFCVDVLDAVFVTEAGGADFLQMLHDTNLFVIDLDDRDQWFRYHHLFQELLLRELHRQEDSGKIAGHYMLASQWFEAEGLIDEALQYALAAENVDHAAQLVVRHRQSAVNDDLWYALEKWLSLLPEPIVQKSAELLMARAWVLMHNVRFEAVLPLADQIETMLSEGKDQDHLRGEIALFRGYVLYFLGDSATSLQFIETALANIPETFFEARAQAEVINALSSQMAGRKDQALRGLDDLLANYDSPQELRKTRLVITHVFIHFLSGDPAAAEVANGRLLKIAERGDYAYATVWSVYMQALIHLQRFEMEAALEQLERTVSKRFIHFKRAAVDSMVALMLTQQILGKEEEARKTLQLLREYVTPLNDAVLWALVGSAEARLAILAGRPEVAAKWLAGADLPSEGAMLWWVEVSSVTRCRALIAAGSVAELNEADEQLLELTRVVEAHHNTVHLIELLVLRVVVSERQGQRDEALDLCSRALELARPGGIIFPFIEVGPGVAPLLRQLITEVGDDEFITRILAALESVDGLALPSGSAGSNSDSPTGPALELLDELTDREREVLCLLENRLQDKEIADHLGISIHTVKHHLKQIYQKLDVHGRKQAVRRATETGLLGEEAAE